MGKYIGTIFIVSVVGLLMSTAFFYNLLVTRDNTQRLNQLTSEIAELKNKAKLRTCYGYNRDFLVCGGIVADKAKMGEWVCNDFGDCLEYHKDCSDYGTGVDCK